MSILTASLPQQLHIPTMENGPELILRFQKELKAIQVSLGLATPNGSYPLPQCLWPEARAFFVLQES